MFEIGNSLREARLRQQLDFGDVEQTTKVRAKYLRALEEENFDVLPAETYVKGFLRTYAEALGLDGQLYVDEYNSRFVTGEEELPVGPRRSNAGPRFSRRIEPRAVVIALAAIAIVFALVIAAWKFGSTPKQHYQGVNTPSARGHGGTTRGARRHTIRRRLVTRLVLTASNGACWLQARAGSSIGPQVYMGTIFPGHQVLLVQRRLWLNAGAPGNLVARVNGRFFRIPGNGQPEHLLVTPRGIFRAPAGT